SSASSNAGFRSSMRSPANKSTPSPIPNSSTRWFGPSRRAAASRSASSAAPIKRDEIVKKAKQTLEEDMTLDANDLPDEMDLASSEYLQSFTFRLRGREK